MTRRAITAKNIEDARMKIAGAIGVEPWRVLFTCENHRATRIEVSLDRMAAARDLTIGEHEALASAGIFLGADGWEIEEDPEPRSRASAALRKAIATMIDPDDVHAVSERQDAAIDKACDAFVTELRAELAPKPEPSPRTTDGALTAYLLEHHREEWRPGEDALALAIRLLGETQAVIDSAHREAEASYASAKELEVELRKVRAELNAANSRAVEAQWDLNVAREAARKAREERDEARRECGRIGNAAAKAVRERDEARADLAKIRGAVRGIAAQLGVPHG